MVYGACGVKFENAEVLDLIQIGEHDLVGKVIFDYTVLSNTYGNRTYHCGYQIVLTHSSGSWKAIDLVVNNDLQSSQQLIQQNTQKATNVAFFDISAVVHYK